MQSPAPGAPLPVRLRAPEAGEWRERAACAEYSIAALGSRRTPMEHRQHRRHAQLSARELAP